MDDEELHDWTLLKSSFHLISKCKRLQKIKNVLQILSLKPLRANDDLLLKLFSEVLRWAFVRRPHLHTNNFLTRTIWLGDPAVPNFLIVRIDNKRSNSWNLKTHSNFLVILLGEAYKKDTIVGPNTIPRLLAPILFFSSYSATWVHWTGLWKVGTFVKEYLCQMSEDKLQSGLFWAR